MKNKKEKVLLTGGAGFIGSHIADLLLNNGYDLIIIDDLSSGKISNLNKKVQFFKTDINNASLEKIFNSEKPDYVCHQAAQISISNSINNPKNDALNNIIGLLNLLDLSCKNGIRGFIFASSGGAIYGDCKSFPTVEDTPLQPSSPYGISKMSSEYYLHFYYQRFGLKYITLRYGNVYGPRQDPSGEAGVIAIFIEKMLNGITPVINGDGEYIRDYVYVKDVANACLLGIQCMLELSVMKNERKQYKTFNAYNIGTGIGTSVNELYYRLQKIIGIDKEVIFGPPRVGDLRKSILDPCLAKKNFDWKAQYNLHDGLKETVEWFKMLYKI